MGRCNNLFPCLPAWLLGRGKEAQLGEGFCVLTSSVGFHPILENSWPRDTAIAWLPVSLHSLAWRQPVRLGFVLNKPCVFGPVTSLLQASALPSITASLCPGNPCPRPRAAESGSKCMPQCLGRSLLEIEAGASYHGQGLASLVITIAPDASSEASELPLRESGAVSLSLWRLLGLFCVSLHFPPTPWSPP